MSKELSVTPEYKKLQESYDKSIALVNDVILKGYLSSLSDYEVVEFPEYYKNEDFFENVRLFEINKIVYEKDEFSLYKLATVLNSVSNNNCSVFVMLNSNGNETKFYMGVRLNDENKSVFNVHSILENSFKGQFPGVSVTNVEDEDITRHILENENKSISSVSCVANPKNSDSKDNASFIQGLEKLALSMQGEKYTAVIIADAKSQSDIDALRESYEMVYTALSPFATNQVNYSYNESTSFALSLGTTHSEGTNNSHTDSRSHSVSQIDEKTKKHMKAQAGLGMATGLISGVATALAGPLGGLVAGVISSPINTAAGVATEINKKTINDTDTNSDTYGTSTQDTESRNETETNQTGSSNASTLTIQNKRVINLLDRIDKQIERLNEFENLGMWCCAAYFIADDIYTSERAANTYRSIMRGEQTGVETSAINSWSRALQTQEKANIIGEYISRFINPTFVYPLNDDSCQVSATSYVSGNELAIHMGLPRHSVCGLSVVEHAEFAKEAFTYDNVKKDSKTIRIGTIFDMGEKKETPVSLDIKSLSMHTFITGSTGSGKSNTVYDILDKLSKNNVNYMVVEPAKGEYKDVFGNRSDVTVLGTNKKVFNNLIRINPFKFPKDSIHVYEHIDRLVEIFNVCWPMYAAMPAVLKEAIINAYQKCGWDLDESTNEYDLFPTFTDLLGEITNVIEKSAYSGEVKGNYIGSLVTRVKSLTNGLNGQIFCANETDNSILFDTNVIVDISRIGSAETKALIMGILVMRLNEYRIDNANGANVGLKHVTVLEEAHNILRRTSTEQNPESPSVAGKSVEMISNSIAEMRTYGEGFIIADQSPTSVDISAIKNTNTKIIMRLPEADDRVIAGKAAGLKDEQLDEIAKLPLGVAVVYQNNWVEPVLCSIDEFVAKDKKNNEVSIIPSLFVNVKKFKAELIKMALSYKNAEKFKFDFEYIKSNIDSVDISSQLKMMAYKLIEEKCNRTEKSFKEICDIVSMVVSDGESFDILISSSTERQIQIELSNVITNKIDDLGLTVDISQCIMYKYAFENPKGKIKYDAWRELVKKGVI